MSVPQIPQPSDNDSPNTNPNPNNDAPLGQFLNRFEPPISHNDVAMAADPAAAGAEVIFRQARPLEGLVSRPGTRTGPRTPEGKAISAMNARSHGCCARKRDAVEEAEFQGIHGELVAEYAPESPEECFAVEQLAEAEFRFNKCQRALQSNAITAIDRHKAERRKPLEEQLLVVEASLHLWEDVASREFALGQGYGVLYPILLKDLDPTSSIKNLRSPDARVFAYRHALATEATPRMRSLLEKYGRWGADRSDQNEYSEYQRVEKKLQGEYYQLSGWVTQHVVDLRHRYEGLKRELATIDAMPVDRDLVELLSEEYRKISRYQKEAESSIHRHRRAIDQIRGRLQQSYDRQMERVQKKHPVMYKVGGMGIHLPKELWGLCAYDQIEAMVKVLLREQRYFDRGARNEFRKIAEMAKPYENEGITAATWNLVDSADGINKRVIGGETALRPANPPPKPPDDADPPR